MKAHWLYFLYVLKHKYWVFRGGLRLGVSLWQLIIHDLSKFSRAEWTPYVDWFYGTKYTDVEERRAIMLGMAIKTRADMRAAFDAAWNHHQKVNPHHWQYWLLITDSDDPRLRPLPIPERYLLEMAADWYGAGMAINGKNDVLGWYEKNKDKIILEEYTRCRLEDALERLK